MTQQQLNEAILYTNQAKTRLASVSTTHSLPKNLTQSSSSYEVRERDKPTSLSSKLKSGGLGFLKGIGRGAALGGAVICGALCLASLGIIPLVGYALIHKSGVFPSKEGNTSETHVEAKHSLGKKIMAGVGITLASPLLAAVCLGMYAFPPKDKG